MNCNNPFLVSVGDFSSSSFSLGSIVISRLFGSELIKISCDKSPNEEMFDLVRSNEIVQIIGDAAKINDSGISWMDGLSDWKQPVILMVEPIPSGELPGSATAYASLCKMLSIPLIGLVQLGGVWKPTLRRRDCLPWCGYIPNEFLDSNFAWDKSNEKYSIFIEDLETILLRRMAFLKL